VVGFALIELHAQGHESAVFSSEVTAVKLDNPSSGKDSDVWQGVWKLLQSKRFVSPHRQP
jgi:hypothetical protein